MNFVDVGVVRNISTVVGQVMFKEELDKGGNDETSKTNDCNERWGGLLS